MSEIACAARTADDESDFCDVYESGEGRRCHTRCFLRSAMSGDLAIDAAIERQHTSEPSLREQRDETARRIDERRFKSSSSAPARGMEP